jgi:hypothetical protein
MLLLQRNQGVGPIPNAAVSMYLRTFIFWFRKLLKSIRVSTLFQNTVFLCPYWPGTDTRICIGAAEVERAKQKEREKETSGCSSKNRRSKAHDNGCCRRNAMPRPHTTVLPSFQEIIVQSWLCDLWFLMIRCHVLLKNVIMCLGNTSYKFWCSIAFAKSTIILYLANKWIT